MISRIEEIIRKNGLTAKQFAEILGVGNSKITDWRNGKTKPTLNDIIGISQKFNITTDYLIFGKDSSSDLTENELELLHIFSKFSEREQIKIIGQLENELKHNKKAPEAVPDVVQQYDIPVAAFGGGTDVQHVTMTPSEYEKWIESLKEDIE